MLCWHWHKADSLMPPYFLSQSCKITKTKRIGHERVMLYPDTSNSFKLLQDPLNRLKSASPTVWFTFSTLLIPPSIPSSTPVGVGSHQISKSSLSYTFTLCSIISSLFGFIWSLPFLFKPLLSPPLSTLSIIFRLSNSNPFTFSLILWTLHPSIHEMKVIGTRNICIKVAFSPNVLIKNCNANWLVLHVVLNLAPIAVSKQDIFGYLQPNMVCVYDQISLWPRIYPELPRILSSSIKSIKLLWAAEPKPHLK